MSSLNMGKDNIIKLILSFSFPAICSTLINAFYNIADRYFVSRYVGEDALVALTISFPVMILVISFTALLGTGGVTLISSSMGENNMVRADRVHGNLISITFIVASLSSILLYLFADTFFKYINIGSDVTSISNVISMGEQYIRIISFGIVFQMFSSIYANVIRAEGRPNLAMLVIFTGGIINIILDYIFVGLIGYGVEGAAFATIIAQGFSFLIPLYYFTIGSSKLRVTLMNLRLKIEYLKSILYIGSSSFIQLIGKSLALYLYNATMRSYGGISGLSALGTVMIIETIAFLPLVGIQQGVQPLISYNYGAGIISRVNQFLLYSILLSTCIVGFGVLFLQIYSDFFISLFIVDKSSPTFSIAVSGLRIYTMILPLLPVSFITTTYLQSTMQGTVALIMGVTRFAIFMVPFLIILPRIFGSIGVWYAMPVTDLCMTLFALLMLSFFIVKQKKI